MEKSEAAKPATAAIGEPASDVERVAALDTHAHTSKRSLIQVRHLTRRSVVSARAADDDTLFDTACTATIKWRELAGHTMVGPPYIQLTPRLVRSTTCDLIAYLKRRTQVGSPHQSGGAA
jgi:hypothetical protein